MSEKEKILIADDSAMNRAILTEMLGDGYEILEAENGRQAVAILQSATDIDLLLLDIMMPEMDGFEVLAMMNKYHWIDEVPVIMISAENASSYVERAYDLGATDYISRPFDMAVVRRRVINTLMLYAKQKRLVRLVAEQVYEKEKSNSTMINILSHIVEFRNGESGMHVLHIQTATDILLHTLVQKTDKYHLTAADISLISTASALHDIGKIGIDDKILNKPGRLTPEEFDALNHCKDYKNSPIPENERSTKGKGSLYSGSLTTFMSKLLTSRTCFGFTTGGHTGEEVFLAAYHPDRTSLPLGMHTNIELNHYLCALFGMTHDTLEELTAGNFAPHTEVFKDFKCEIVPAKDEKGSPSLVVKNKRKQINITPFSNIVTIGKKGQEEIRLNSVIVYVDKNNTFYLPTKLVEYLQ